jgi:hypothetical protein
MSMALLKFREIEVTFSMKSSLILLPLWSARPYQRDFPQNRDDIFDRFDPQDLTSVIFRKIEMTFSMKRI